MGKDNHFHITIGAVPHQGDSLQEIVQHDLQMVKAALLYADKVTLCSPISWRLSVLINMQGFSHQQKLRVVELLLPTITQDQSSSDTRMSEFAFEAYKSLADKKYLHGQALILRRGWDNLFNSTWEGINQKAALLADEVKIAQLTRALKSGILTVEKLGPTRDTVELLADLVERSELSRTPSECQQIDPIVADFLERLKKIVKSDTTYPLFDDQAGHFVQLGVSAGAIEFSEGQAARAKHVGLAANLIERLPLFDLATVNDILDIRQELNQPLLRFRRAMIQFSKNLKSLAWDEDFPIEVEEIFRTEVETVILEIEEAIQSNKYLIELLKQVVGPTVLLPAGGSALGLVVSNMSSFPEIAATLLGIGIGSAVLATEAYRAWKQNQDNIEKNQLFFYYQAKGRLSRLPHRGDSIL